MPEEFIEMEVGCCGTIWSKSEEACALAKKESKDVVFTFNGIRLCVRPTSDAHDIATIYNLSHHIRRMEAKFGMIDE